MLEIIVCEDNEAALAELCKTIERVILNNKLNSGIVLRAQNAEGVEKHIDTSLKPTQLFILDIMLDNSYCNGFELAKKIREREKGMMQQKCYILFISSVTYKYMGFGYDVHAYNCLQKPIQKHMLEEVLLDIYNDYLVHETSNKLRGSFIKVKSGPEVYNLKCEDIIYIERNKLTRKTRIITEKLDIQTRDPIHALESELHGTPIVKCNRSLFVNKNKIISINRGRKAISLEIGEHKQITLHYASGYENELGV